VLRAQVSGQIADARLERGLRDAHHVVVREDALAAQVREREDAAATARFHQRQGGSRERDERVGGHVQSDTESFARRLDERLREILTQRVGRAVDQKVQTAVLFLNLGEKQGHLLVVRDVARQQRDVRNALAELTDVLAEPLVLIREDERRAFGRGGLRD